MYTYIEKCSITIPLIVMLFIFPAACSINPATGDRHFTAFMSLDDEKRIGYEEHPKIINKFGGVYDHHILSNYISKLGTRIAQVSELPELNFRFTVLNSSHVNAFALPGGYIYVTRGLITLAENEAELASVIAHEIGHVTARHTAQRYSQAMATNIGLSIVGVIGSIYGAPRGTSQFLSVGAEAVLSGYSRDQELEADMLGVRYLKRLGYDPNAITTFFRKMKANDELNSQISNKATVEDSFNFRSSHPRTTDRISQAIELVRDNRTRTALVNRNTFLDSIDGVIFGDDPKEGIQQGQKFIHPHLQFEFSVPEDFTMHNTPQRVVSRHPNGSVIIFDMEISKDTQNYYDDLRSYLLDKWGRKLDITNTERLVINGMEAWTGHLQNITRSGPRDIRLVAVRSKDKDVIFRFVFMIPIDKLGQMQSDLKRTIYSFRRLTLAESKQIKPLRISTITASTGDTPYSISRTMDLDNYELEWFNLINLNVKNNIFSDSTRVKVIRW